MIEANLFGVEAFMDRLRNATNSEQELRQGMLRSLIHLQRRVKEKLSDDVLHVRTGTLRRSINYALVSESGGELVGIVGTNVGYAAVHEYGFHGTVNVRSYIRRVRGAGHTTNSGKWIKGKVTGEATVSAHTRTVNLPERSFLRSALQEMLPDFKIEMQEAVRRAVGLS